MKFKTVGFQPTPGPLFEKSGAKTLTLRIWAKDETAPCAVSS
jgi:hypothetical protein